MSKKKVVDFIKALEESNLIRANSHKSDKVVETVDGIISMTEEEHDNFQEKNPSKSVLMIFTEYQDWKETYNGV